MKNPKQNKNGKVFLTGAGPGDPGLLTWRGVQLLQKADAVVYDALVNPALLEIAARAEKIDAGKKHLKSSKKCRHFSDQQEINRTLVKLARQGKQVVRLKGGDPFIFGRGGEEASYLKKAGIAFEVVPGVSAGSAAPAYAGIPVTDRRLASQVTFVTAHENPDKSEVSADWPVLAKLKGTLVIFMGIQNLKNVTRALIAGGKAASTPVSVIERGTTEDQRVVTGTLGTIAALAKKQKVCAPALTVIGEVNRLRKETQWLASKPLSGKKILVTRARTQAGALSRLLREQGASVIEFPVIEILPPENWVETDAAVRKLAEQSSLRGSRRLTKQSQVLKPRSPRPFGARDDGQGYDWVIFTSVNGVEAFCGRLKELGHDARIFAGKKIAVIGEATAESLESFGIKADLVPEEFTSEGLIRALRRERLTGEHFLLARTDIAPPYIYEELQKLGARVTELTVYRTVPSAEKARKKELEKWVRARKIDYVTFTSSSTVKYFFQSLPAPLRKQVKAKLISIGPVTTGTLKEFGVRPYREAKKHTLAGLVDAITQ